MENLFGNFQKATKSLFSRTTTFGSVRYALIVLFVLLLIPQFLSASTIKGKITDGETGDGLPAANVLIKGTSIGAAANLNGAYTLTNVPPGQYTLMVSYIGYNTETVDVIVPPSGSVEKNVPLTAVAVEGEGVVVTAQAMGQIQAINQQLNSDKIESVVSEAKIQELPDFNAAASLGRLPGVSTTQSSGEANKVVIRGLSPKYNSIEIEGVKLSSTGSSNMGLSSDTYVSTPGVSNDRSVDLTMVSPYMIRMISVYKSLTPDMNANSIGGTVNMELREAPSDFHWSAMWQQGYTAKSNTYGNYRAVLSGSDRFFNDKLGVYALANMESYDRNSDNMDASYDIKSADVDSTTGFRPVAVNTVTFNRHLETRNRYGANLILDYTLPKGSIKFINMFARINSDYQEFRQGINYNSGTMTWQTRDGENVIDQQMHSLKLDYDLSFLTADLAASYTASHNQTDKLPVINFNQTGALQGITGVERYNKKPQDLTYLLTEFKGDSAVVLRSGNLFSNDYKEEKYSYKADFELPFNVKNKLTGFFKFGGQMNNQTNKTDQESPYLGFNGSATDPNATGIQAELMRTLKAKYDLNVDAQGNLTGDSFLNPDKDLFDPFLDDKYGAMYYAADPTALNTIIKYVIGNPDFDASNSQASTGSAGGWYDGPYQQLTNDYRYEEDYYAAYAMSKINWKDFMVIGGARYEKVKTEYFAYNARDMRNAQSQVMYDTTDNKENEFLLPMVQGKYSPMDWMDVRYAYTQTLARPDYHSLTPKFTITQANQIFTGNPNLKPAKAFNHDLSLTFHSNKVGLFTVGAFYKTIEKFVYTADYKVGLAAEAGIDSISRYQIVRDGQYVVTPLNDQAIVYRPLNNPFDATVKGLEFDWQHNFWYLPKPWGDMVFGINYTRIWSKTKYPFFDEDFYMNGRLKVFFLVDSAANGRLIDQPDHVLNAYVGYDHKGFSARLSCVYQDNSARGNGGRNPENDSYTKEYFRIDLSARQKMPWYNSELFLDISNLNSANTKWIQKSIEGFRGIENYGLTANLGIRIRY